MKRNSAFLLAAGLALAAGASGALAQDDKMARPPEGAEAIVYRDAGFEGPAVNVRRAMPNTGFAFKINSIRVRSGQWELCSELNFRGSCRTFTADNSRISRWSSGMQVKSLRPLGSAVRPPVNPIEPGNNPSLKGMAAEFFPEPARGGRRVLACLTGSATANCAAASADRFCKVEGYAGSASQRMQTVGGRNYLADVLCTKTGS